MALEQLSCLDRQCILSTFSFEFSLRIYNYHSQDLFSSVNLQNCVLHISSLYVVLRKEAVYICHILSLFQ